jgi:hypothetical protein
MTRIATALAAAVVATIAAALPARADPLRIEAVMSPREQIQLNFQDGTRHFVLMVRREGQATGEGPLAGAAVTEYGMHDIVPGVGGDPLGYLVFTAANGDIAYVRWRVRAIFIPGADGRPQLLDNGVWEVVGGTGALADLVGAGTMHIRAVSPTDRRFILQGEVTRRR